MTVEDVLYKETDCEDIVIRKNNSLICTGYKELTDEMEAMPVKDYMVDMGILYMDVA